MSHLSGHVCVRNNFLLDYCAELAVQSMLPVCDEIVVCDGESTDGTKQFFEEWSFREPKIRVVTYPWPGPHRDLGWWVNWLQFARGHLRFPTQLALDADEVLDARGFETIRRLANERNKSALFHRINYWRDPQHQAPHNRCCGTLVARLGPSDLYMPSDEPHPAVHPNIRTAAARYPGLWIHHLGFLRKPEAFIAKSKVVQNAFFGSVDSRLIDAEQQGQDWRQREYFDGLSLEPATEPLPELIKPWLRTRGYNCP